MLAAGRCSMLLYTLLHLTEVKGRRSEGPLGQGVPTSVGMAIAGRWAARHWKCPSFELFGYDVDASPATVT